MEINNLPSKFDGKDSSKQDNATRRKIHWHRSKEVYEMELGRERLSNFFKDFKKFWDDLKINVDEKVV